MLDKIKLIALVRPSDMKYLLKLIVTFIPGMVYRLTHRDVWIVSEYAENARDNGYWLFKYIRETYPEKTVYYPIKKTASDFHKIEVLGNYVEFASLRHYMLFWAARKYVGTTKYHGFPDERIAAGFYEFGLARFKYVFLNHGFTRGKSNIVNGRLTSYDLVIAISEIEKKVMVEVNGQKEEKIQAIGFCRHDNLDDSIRDPKMILVMPTWRRWLDYRHEGNSKKIKEIKEKFLESEYYAHYLQVLRDDDFIRFLEENDLHVLFYLHGYAQIHADCFRSRSERIKVARKEEYFVQDLLKQASFLVTDYSSVAADYAYMKKPMLYYQFDEKEFSEKQYAGSRFYQFERDGFGPVVYDWEHVKETIRKSYENGFEMEDQYKERVEQFFPSFGKDHCRKTYDLIETLR